MTEQGKSTLRSASIDGGEVTLWVRNVVWVTLSRCPFFPHERHGEMHAFVA